MSATSFLERVKWHADTGDIRDGDIRYMMIRPDALMGLFLRLPDTQRTAALDAFADSIFEHGGRSAKIYQNMGADQAVALLSVIVDTAGQLGWGVWTFSPIRADGFSLTVDNSPFAAGFGSSERPVCSAIAGMLRAVGALVLNAACDVAEVHCAASENRDFNSDTHHRCQFHIKKTVV